MEFGKLETIDCVDWQLPSENPSTAAFLRSLGEGSSRVYLGAPAWGCKEWVGRLYPPKVAASEFLFHYSRNFNCIELNTTHYRIPARHVVENWLTQVPNGFLFCPKVPKAISHDPGGLRNVQTIAQWRECLTFFKTYLGPCFLQLPPAFDYDRKRELFYFLEAWPSEVELALELRHPSWFNNGHVLLPLVEYLRARKIGLVITDVAGRRDVLHASLSASFSFLRLIGNGLHASDFLRAEDWIRRLDKWRSQGLKRFFFIVHQPDDLKTPEMADWVVTKLNSICRESLPPLAKPLL